MKIQAFRLKPGDKVVVPLHVNGSPPLLVTRTVSDVRLLFPRNVQIKFLCGAKATFKRDHSLEMSR